MTETYDQDLYDIFRSSNEEYSRALNNASLAALAGKRDFTVFYLKELIEILESTIKDIEKGPIRNDNSRRI